MQKILGFFLFIAKCLLALCLATGCGGGGGGSTPPPPVPQLQITATINWAERSRDVNGPSSAQSFVLRVFAARPDGTDLVFIRNRRDPSAAYTETVTTSAAAAYGIWNASVGFYSGRDGGGDLVAQGDTTVLVGDNNRDLGTVTLSQKVASVTIVSDQSVGLNQTKDVLVTARSSDNSIIALTPGSIFLTQQGGSGEVQIIGPAVTGFRLGTVQISATVDGVVSAPGIITVTGSSGPTNGTIYFVGPNKTIQAMNSDGSNVRTLFTAGANVSSLSEPSANEDGSLIVFTAVSNTGDTSINTIPITGGSLTNVFNGASRTADAPSSPRWSRMGVRSGSFFTGFDGIFFIESIVNPAGSFRSQGFIRTVNGNVFSGEIADMVGIGDWSADRPLIATQVSNGDGTTELKIDGVPVGDPATGFTQPAVGAVKPDGTFVMLALDQNSNINLIRCQTAPTNDSLQFRVTVNSITRLTDTGNFANPNFGPNDEVICAQRGDFEGPVIVTMDLTGSNVRVLANGRTPSWR